MVDWKLRLSLKDFVGRFMQLISIENLSLAAEATAVLLLLAFAWPERRTSEKAAQVEGESANWEPAKNFYLQACLYRGLYLQQCKQTSPSLVPFAPVEDPDDTLRPSIPLPWHDRLTKCLNRNGFDSVLRTWLSLEVKKREESCLTMLTLNRYSEMVAAQGAMVTEQALQTIAKQLLKEVGQDSIVARYLPDRFVILHLVSSLSDCHKTMKSAQTAITNPDFFDVAGVPFSIACKVSLMGLGGEMDIAARIDELDEGVVEADSSGRNILTKVDGHWTDSFVDDEPKALNLESQSRSKTFDKQSTFDSSNTSAPIDSTNEYSEREGQVVQSIESKDAETSEANDISAIANPDDIAALFASTPAKAVAAQDLSEIASADEIASLFASVKSAVKLPTTDATSVTVETPISIAAKNTDDSNEVATEDDIAALFATVKSAVKTTAAEMPVKSPSLPTSTEQLEEVATADDIELLFKTVKKDAESSSQETLKGTIAPKAVVVPDDELSSNASMDDIEALFASMKK